MSKLLVVSDGKRDRELRLVERLVVGRDPMCDLSHDDALLSRRHAEFAMAGEEVTVRDLGSRNGLFVNGSRAAQQVLRPGDIVQIGPLRVRYMGDRDAGGYAPEDQDFDSTLVVPGPTPKNVSVAGPPTPTPSSVRVATPKPPPPAPAAPPAAAPDGEPDDEEVTGYFRSPPDMDETFAPGPDPGSGSGSGSGSGVFAAAVAAANYQPEAGEFDLTTATPGPSALGRSVAEAMADATLAGGPSSSISSVTVARPMPPVAAQAPPAAAGPSALPVEAAADAGEAGLGTFVFVQMAALAVIVFLTSAAPLLLDRGSAPGGVAGLLLWPVLPLVVALAATYVVSGLVTRRVQATLTTPRRMPRA